MVPQRRKAASASAPPTFGMGFMPRQRRSPCVRSAKSLTNFRTCWKDFGRPTTPTDAAQEGLVIRLARDTWRMNRVDRIQEGCAMRQAQEMNAGRENRLHARMMRLAMTADTLRLLARSVACKHYVTPRSDLERIKNLHEEGVLADMSEIILGLFYDLQA